MGKPQMTLCLFGHIDCLLATLARTGKKNSITIQKEKNKCVCQPVNILKSYKSVPVGSCICLLLYTQLKH